MISKLIFGWYVGGAFYAILLCVVYSFQVFGKKVPSYSTAAAYFMAACAWLCAALFYWQARS